VNGRTGPDTVSLKWVPRSAEGLSVIMSSSVPSGCSATDSTLPSTPRSRAGRSSHWVRVLRVATGAAVIAVTVAGCTAANPDDTTSESVSPSPSASPTADASFDSVTIDPANLAASVNQVSASAELTDQQGYTYDASWWGSYEVGEPDISEAPPGFADLPVFARAGVTLRNTTAGRDAPAALLAQATLLALFASDRLACAVLPDSVNVANTTYCLLSDAKFVGQYTQLNSPLAPDETTEGSDSLQSPVRVSEDQVASVAADLASGPTAWVFAAPQPTTDFGINYDGVTSPTGSCELPGQGFGIPDTTILWASTELAGCPTPLIGATAVSSSPADGEAAGQVIDDLFSNWADATLSRCPALRAGGSAIRPIVAGMDGVDGSLSFEPVAVPQDIEGNQILCSTPEGAPGGVFLRLQRPDLTEVDPQAMANRARDAYGGHLTISQPIDLAGGTLVISAADGATAIVTWSDGNLNVSGYVGTDPADSEQAKFDRVARWMALNLPTMLDNIAAFEPTDT